MGIVKDKYRGTTTYFHVLAELVRAAQYRGVTTYQDIAVIMGLPSSGSHMGRETGHILGEISEDEVESKRPMLSAVAVGVNGKPGPGFYALAKQLGLMKATDHELTFWEGQRRAAYEALAPSPAALRNSAHQAMALPIAARRIISRAPVPRKLSAMPGLSTDVARRLTYDVAILRQLAEELGARA
jgi:hypothetical protein